MKEGNAENYQMAVTGSDDVHTNKKQIGALALMTQCIERWPADQEVTALIPSQGTCLGCGPGPW